MKFFKNLSDEIVLDIFKKVSQKDLARLAQVDKRFKRITDDETLKPKIKVADLIFNKIRCFQVNRTDKVLDLKKQIEKEIKVKTDQQTLIFFSKQMDDDQMLSKTGLVNTDVGSFAHLVRRK